MWLQGRLGFTVTGGGIACETHPQSACSLVTFDCCRITPAAHDLFLQEGFPVFELVRLPSWNQGGNNDHDLGMVQGERGSCLYGLMCKEVPSTSWSEVLEPGYLLPGLRGQLASVNSGVCPHGPESLEVWPMVEETESVC